MHSNILAFALSALVLPLPSALAAAPFPVRAQFDSVQQTIVDAKISHGYILTPKPDDSAEDQIYEQLNYLLGQLNWFDAAPQSQWFDVEITGKSKVPNTPLTRVNYTATGHVSWSRAADLPPSLDLILPARGDEQGLADFTSKYLKPCTNDDEADEDSFFYYYFPLLDDCPLQTARPSDKLEVARFPMKLSPSATNTTGKSPEYGKVWEDGKLTVTITVSKYDADENAPNDAGVGVYNQLYSGLIASYGNPIAASDHFEGEPGTAHPILDLVFALPQGRILQTHLELVDGLEDIDDAFKARYAQRTQISDLMIYDGHAGLGSNVEALGQLGTFTPGRYQLYMINGCDSFTHLDDDLFTQHGRANPGSAPSKYLDVITNSMSNYFGRMADETLAVIQAMIDEKLTYHQILEKFDPEQRSVVDGEQDNAWPAPFTP